MNARLYDPALGRFLSPDPYVQAPDFSQNFNRYSYCLNNPLRFTDPSGELLFSWFSGAISGFWRGVFQGKDIFKSTWDGFRNSVKIDWGLFKGTPLQIASRLSWELPQTIVGNVYSQFRNLTWSVDEVRYFDGATYVINENASRNDGITLGSYININDKNKMPKDINGKFDPTQDYLYMHEYGHYLDGQLLGISYLFVIGLPSIVSASKHDGKHYKYWTEKRANKKAANYFRKHYGIIWSSPLYPIK